MEGRESAEVVRSWQMSMPRYIVLPVFGQKWPIVSGRTSQLGPRLHPHQPDKRTDRTKTLSQSNISSYAYDYIPLCEIFSHISFSTVKFLHASLDHWILQMQHAYMQVTCADIMVIVRCLYCTLIPNKSTN